MWRPNCVLPLCLDHQEGDKTARPRDVVTSCSAFDQACAVGRQWLSDGRQVQQLQSTMRDHVFPAIGGARRYQLPPEVGRVLPELVLLLRIEHSGPEP
jgi:hypothetical protein